ncbi:MAG: hypothetical protein PHN75_19445, partial [Syntrophales bacterium]|nr:hypothetical protein [Syntrophales bacterium]
CASIFLIKEQSLCADRLTECFSDKQYLSAKEKKERPNSTDSKKAAHILRPPNKKNRLKMSTQAGF